MATNTWRLVVQYDGGAFSGWQRQAAHVTVQSVLEDALGTLFGVPRVVVHASGRTDAGVHALGQVVSFRSEAVRDPHRVRMGLNTMLPPEVSVVEVALAPAPFHARYSATGKTYRYRVLNRRDRSPFSHRYALHVRASLDWAAVAEAMTHLVGTHDFSAFRGSGCTARSPVRTVDRAELREAGEERWLEFHGNGFLRYQVRRMVGTLLDVGRGRKAASSMPDIIASRDPSRAGRTALACGLFLVGVDYPPEALALLPTPGVVAKPG